MVEMIPFDPHTFMMIVGVIEIITRIIVFAKPKIGGFIVAIWLALIALTLIIGWQYLDIAVRDIVMAIAAFSMASLTGIIHKSDPNLTR